jgi:competence protein ComEA
VADAIDAAGGYAPEADLDAAARQLNLAAALTDGQQLRVPRIGEADAGGAPPGESQGSGAGGGLVNLNTASADELDALPGIGPVTVEKIIAARQQAPFSSLDDAVARDVMNAGQLEKIRDLATV